MVTMKGNDIAIAAVDKAALVEFLKSAQGESKSLLRVTMLCGVKMTYKTVTSIPEESVACPCGDVRHWVIKYTG